MGGLRLSEDDQDLRIEKNKKFTIEYDKKFVEENITTAPCNIWGVIQDLIQKINDLETRLSNLENSSKS